MEPKKHWDGYTSFSYLVEGEDFVPFEMAPQIGRVAPTIVPLDAADQRNESDRLLHELVCISLHDHCGIMPVDMADNDAYVREGREHYGYEGLAGLRPRRRVREHDGRHRHHHLEDGVEVVDVIHDLGMHLADVAHQSTMFFGRPRSTTSSARTATAASP